MVTKKTTVDPMLRASKAGGYLPEARSIWVEYREEGSDEDSQAIRVRIRTGLTNMELDRIREPLPEDAKNEDAWDRIAPYVIDWNIQHRAEDGVVYDVAPPAEVGGGAFKYLPFRLFLMINSDIIGVPYRKVDPKSSSESGSTPVA